MKKVLLIADTEEQYQTFQSERIKKIVNQVVPFDAEVEMVFDKGLLCNNDQVDAALLKIEKEGPEWVIHEEEFLKKVEDVNIIIVHFSAVGKMLIDRAKNLELVVTMRGGVENINVDYCKEKGIAVSNSPGRNAEQVSDMTIALMLAFNRNIKQNDLTLNKGFKLTYPQNPMLVKDMTLGLIGFGGIGKMIAKKLSGYNCKIVAYDPFVEQSVADEFNVEMLELNDLMKISDVVSVHARLLPETKGLVGKEQLNLMQKHAYFINTARAGLVDEEALTTLLVEKKIRGAALDVFSIEPLPEDSILRKLDNVILTPHIAGRIEDGYTISARIVVDEILRYLKDNKLSHKIN